MRGARQQPVTSGPVRSARRRGPAALLVAAFAALLAISLVPFHVWLLWERLSDLSIRQPGVALRWLAAAAIIAAGLRELRAGRPLLRGKRALALWTLAFLLHAGTTPALARPLPLVAPPPAVHLFWLVPFGLTGGLPESLLRLLSAVRRRRPSFSATRFWQRVSARILPLALGQRPALGAPRPPPLFSAALASA